MRLCSNWGPGHLETDVNRGRSLVERLIGGHACPRSTIKRQSPPASPGVVVVCAVTHNEPPQRSALIAIKFRWYKL